MSGRGRNRGRYVSKKGSAGVNNDGGQGLPSDAAKLDGGGVTREDSRQCSSKYACGVCKVRVTSDDKGLQCEYCGLWYHITCVGVDDVKYNLLSDDGIHWFCKTCDGKAIDVLLLVQSIKEKQDSLEEKFNELNVKVQNIEKIEGHFSTSIREVVREEMYEANEKEKRKCNVIIKNLNELVDDSSDGDSETKEEEEKCKEARGIKGCVSDKEIAEHVIQNVLQLKEINVVQAERIDSRWSNRRPLRVRLEKKEHKFKILNKSKQLKNNSSYQDVFISPDKTYAEREKDKDLRAELSERRDKGEKNLIIKNCRVIQQPILQARPAL